MFGRKVCLGAKNYFRVAAVKDAIMTENRDELTNYKLFNDIVNSLEEQGHILEPKILLFLFTRKY